MVKAVVASVDWFRWLPFALTVIVVIASQAYFAGQVTVKVDANSTRIDDIANHDVASIRQEVASYATVKEQVRSIDIRVSRNEISRDATNDRLARIETNVIEIKRILERQEK